jgi:hypothetical protein
MGSLSADLNSVRTADDRGPTAQQRELGRQAESSLRQRLTEWEQMKKDVLKPLGIDPERVEPADDAS